MNRPTIRFPQFSAEWTGISIRDLASKVGSGSTPRGGRDSYLPTGVPFIRSQNVHGGALDESGLAFISPEVHLRMKATAVRSGDVLLNITGASLGRTCVVPQSLTEANVSQHVCIIRPREGYLPYMVHSALSRPDLQFRMKQVQTGGGKDGLNFEAVGGLVLRLPSQPEQQKITTFLMAVDEQVSLLARRLEVLRRYRDGLASQLFSRRLRLLSDEGASFPAWTSRPLSDLFRDVDDRVGDRADLTPHSISAGTGFVSQQAKFGGDISGEQWSSYLVLDPGQFAYNRGSSKTFRFGCVYRNTSGMPFAVPNVFIGFEALQREVVPEFFQHYFAHHQLDTQLRRIISSSARLDGLLNVAKRDFFAITVSVPSIAEQHRISEILSTLDELLDAESAKLALTKEFKRGLLQKMFI